MLAFIYVLDVDTSCIVVEGYGHSTSSGNAGGKRRTDPKISSLLPSLTNVCIERLKILVLTSEHILQRCPLLQSGSKTKCVANSCPATHQTLQQQGGTGEDGHIHLAGWTLSVAAIEKNR